MGTSLVRLTMRSNQTPARPESRHAAVTAAMPSTGCCTAPVGERCLGDCTSTTPRNRRPSDAHRLFEMCRLSKVTVKKAVVSSLSWYATWQVAASRCDVATYSKLFWIRYSSAGTPTRSVSRHCTNTDSHTSRAAGIPCCATSATKDRTILTTSADTTAVDDRYLGCEGSREYRMESI